MQERMQSAPLPPRPEAQRSIADRCVAWIRWFGLGRLIGAGCSMALVVAGAVWLLRAPLAPVESGLPSASAAASMAPPTLPLPTSTVIVTAPTATTAAVSSELMIHAAGQVISPGVYRLPGGSRVADAVAAAGGVAPDGDADGLNLAAPLADGQRVYVPAVGEVDPASVPPGGMTGVQAPGQPTAGAAPGPLDLNEATAAELEALPGVGPALAAAIVEDRQRNGPFAAIEDLDRVSGIGPAKLAALRGQVRV